MGREPRGPSLLRESPPPRRGGSRRRSARRRRNGACPPPQPPRPRPLARREVSARPGGTGPVSTRRGPFPGRLRRRPIWSARDLGGSSPPRRRRSLYGAFSRRRNDSRRPRRRAYEDSPTTKDSTRPPRRRRRWVCPCPPACPACLFVSARRRRGVFSRRRSSRRPARAGGGRRRRMMPSSRTPPGARRRLSRRRMISRARRGTRSARTPTRARAWGRPKRRPGGWRGEEGGVNEGTGDERRNARPRKIFHGGEPRSRDGPDDDASSKTRSGARWFFAFGFRPLAEVGSGARSRARGAPIRPCLPRTARGTCFSTCPAPVRGAGEGGVSVRGARRASRDPTLRAFWEEAPGAPRENARTRGANRSRTFRSTFER